MEGTRHEATRRAALQAVGGGGLLTALSVMGASTASAATRPTLKRGSTGSHVLAAQKRLNALTYWTGTPDGNFGPQTQQAVWALQKVAHVTRSGIIDARTWGLLDMGKKANPRATSGTVIVCDIAENTLMLVKSGKLTLTLNTSTGSGERYYSGGKWKTAVTPRGTFSIYYRWSSGWQYGSLGAMWRPTYFKGGYAIHGSSSIPAYPASHGCLRVSASAQNKLWAEGWLPIGRKIHIY